MGERDMAQGVRRAVAFVLLVAAWAAPSLAAPRAGIEHVFIIVLENQSFDVTFGPASPAPYLAKTLPAKGVLLKQYFGTGHVSLDNYIAMISGQAATNETRLDCRIYQDFAQTGVTPDGQAIGGGCVYPAGIKTIADQLAAAGKTWRGYMEDMGNDPAREASTCGHPALNADDGTQRAEPPSASVPKGDQYATRHDPFVYFHSIIDGPDCAANVVRLERLEHDLKKKSTTPNFVFITPNLCHDGHDTPCKNGEPGGLVSADRFLRKWVPRIMSSPAFRHHGLLVVTFDESGLSATKDAAGELVISAPGATCCNQQPGPNIGTFPQTVKLGRTTLSFQSFGGDRIGAVLLSPFLKPGTVSETPFNHYALLKTVEDIFGLDHLGYAGQHGLAGLLSCAASDVVLRGSVRSALCAPD
ncbi:MAG TPA: alkaline phosphatase family protein [Stellaceae bacterium]|nr:alkaline phosphatase family protein [Stellaceae bacterium]